VEERRSSSIRVRPNQLPPITVHYRPLPSITVYYRPFLSDAHYDQVAFFPGTMQNCFAGRKGVFDYDAVVFADLFGVGGKTEMAKFKAYCRYHISDHRPMWVELSIP
jgi:hypothetical protein